MGWVGGQQIKQVQLNFEVAPSTSEIQAVHFILDFGSLSNFEEKFCLRSFFKISLYSQVSPFESVDIVPDGEAFTLANTYIKAHFSDQGLLQVKCI